MIRKIVQGAAVAVLMLTVPVWIQPAILSQSQVWILFLVAILGSTFQPAYSPFAKAPDPKDRGTAAQIIWTVYLTQLAALLEAASLRYPASFRFDAISGIALVLIVAGLALRTWAVLLLGRFFTWHIEVLPDQRIIRAGPYRFIRHPGYAGALLTYFASTVFLHSWISAIIAGVALPLAFLRRIRHEESLLRKSFDDYEAYAAETKMLIPGIL